MKILKIKIYIGIFLVFLLLCSNSSFALIKGHYETNGKGCYIAKSVLGKITSVCDCPKDQNPVVIGAIITSICTCSADSLMFQVIQYAKMPSKLEPPVNSYLTFYHSFLLSLETEKASKLADDITFFYDAVREGNLKQFIQSEIDYVEIFDSMSQVEKTKIQDWLKANEYH